MTSNKHITRKEFHITCHAVERLQACLEEISRPYVDASTTKEVVFYLYVSVNFTPKLLALFLEVLNQSLPKAPPTCTITDFRWDHVKLHFCSFQREDTTSGPLASKTRDKSDGEGCCSLKEKRLLGATLARRTKFLELRSSHQIFECLHGISNLEMTRLDYSECDHFPAVHWNRSLFQRSVPLTHLSLFTRYWVGHEALVEPLANAIHLQVLSISEWQQYNWYPGRRRKFNDVLVGSQNDGHGIVPRLLQNPKSQLQKLSIRDMCLEDHHLMTIVDVLLPSRLEVLYVSGNKITRQGILAMAAQLPNIQCLKILHLDRNPWEYSHVDDQEGFERCWAALEEAMCNNYCMEFLKTMRPPVTNVARNYGNLNRAGRRILSQPYSIPTGLWPFILERAGKDIPCRQKVGRQ